MTRYGDQLETLCRNVAGIEPCPAKVGYRPKPSDARVPWGRGREASRKGVVPVERSSRSAQTGSITCWRELRSRSSHFRPDRGATVAFRRERSRPVVNSHGAVSCTGWGTEAGVGGGLAEMPGPRSRPSREHRDRVTQPGNGVL
jgi:hypothetical protein